MVEYVTIKPGINPGAVGKGEIPQSYADRVKNSQKYGSPRDLANAIDVRNLGTSGGGSGGISSLGSPQSFQSPITGGIYQNQMQLREAESKFLNQQIQQSANEQIQRLSQQNQMNLRNIGSISQRQDYIKNLNKDIDRIRNEASFLSQQAQKDPSKFVEKWNPNYEKEYYKQSLGDTLKRVVSEKSLEPLEQYGKRVSEIKGGTQTGILKGGTITAEEKPFYTYSDIQKNIDLSKLGTQLQVKTEIEQSTNLLKDRLQKAVDEGTFTIEEAQKMYGEKQELEFEKAIKDKPVYQDIYSKTQQTGGEIKQNIEVLGSMASLSTPQTSILMGVKEATAQEKRATIIREADGSLPLYPTYKEKDYSSPLFFAGAIGGGLGAMQSVEKTIIKEELTQLSQQPTIWENVKIKSSGGVDLNIMKGTQQFRGLTTEINVIGKSYNQKGGKFLVPGAKVTSTTYGDLSWNVIGGKTPTKITSVSEFKLGSEGTSFPLNNKNKIFGTISRETLIPEKSTGLIWTTRKATTSEKIAGKRFAERQGKKLAREIVESYEFGGDIIKTGSSSINKKLKNKIIASRSGKLDTIKIDLGAEQALLKGELTDFGLTKIIYPEKESGVKIINIIGGRKTPLSKTFAIGQEPVLKFSEETTEEIIKKPGKTILSKLESEIKPSYVSSSIQPLSESYYSGNYNIFTRSSTPLDITYSPSKDILMPSNTKLYPNTTTKTKVFPNQLPRIYEKTAIYTPTKLGDLSILKNPTKEKNIIISSQSLTPIQIQPLRERLLQAQSVSQVTKQVLRNREGFNYINNYNQQVKIPFKVKIPFSPGIPAISLGKSKTNYLKKGKETEELFIPYVKRYGKYKQVSKPLTLKKAKRIGVSSLKSTLGASLQIIKAKTGELIPIAKGETETFRPGKKGKDPFTLVQKAGRRLSSYGEVTEIMKARKGIKFKL